jgi:hypothetical protein
VAAATFLLQNGADAHIADAVSYAAVIVSLPLSTAAPSVLMFRTMFAGSTLF